MSTLAMNAELLVLYEGKRCQVIDNRVIGLFGFTLDGLEKAFYFAKKAKLGKIKIKNTKGTELSVDLTELALD